MRMGNANIILETDEDASQILLHDTQRGNTWRLDRTTMGYRRADCVEELCPFDDGVITVNGNQLTISFTLPEGSIRYRWTMLSDAVEVEAEVQADGIATVSLPGSFQAATGPTEVALPIYQGLLLRQPTGNWTDIRCPGGHLAFSMSMAGFLSTAGALLVAQENPTAWRGVFGAKDGTHFFYTEAMPCPVDGWGRRALRLYLTEPAVTAICKQYKARLVERGDFVPWSVKLAQKPALKDLFGSLMAFIGYNKTSDIDYAASARYLRDYGFESVYYYPVRMLQYSLGFKMGGDDPIWFTDEEIAAMHKVKGAKIGPWGWVFEGLDDGTIERQSLFRIGSDGKPIPFWKIDDFQWYMVCTPFQFQHMRDRLASDMSEMDWVHYDVNATDSGKPCFSTDHATHRGKPISKWGDVLATRELFSSKTVGNRIVSSEGFNDLFAGHYDIGSTKLLPGSSASQTTPVPLTMLVFHDSCIHDAWELHNYNQNPGWGIAELPCGLGEIGSGKPRLKAAMDALYGCPPNLFPFGKQYGWVSWDTRETFSFQNTLDDPGVQEALRVALPVAKLHKEIGMQEMVDFQFLSEDRLVQTTIFSDGTRIVSNLSDTARQTEYGVMPPQTWIKR